MSKNDSFESECSSNCEEEIEIKTKNTIKKDSPKSNVLDNKLLKAISITLTSILEQNKNLENYKEIIQNQSYSIFSGNFVPNISVKEYLERIQTYANIEKSTLIICLIYIDRLCNKAKITLTYYNIHRILFSSIIIGIKYNEDCFYDNKYYSQIAGVKMKELTMLEYNFIKMLNCELYVSKELYDKYQVYLDNFDFEDN